MIVWYGLLIGVVVNIYELAYLSDARLDIQSDVSAIEGMVTRILEVN